MYIVHGVEYGKYTRLSNEIDELLWMDSTFDSIPLKVDIRTYFLPFFSSHHIKIVNAFSVLYASSVFKT